MQQATAPYNYRRHHDFANRYDRQWTKERLVENQVYQDYPGSLQHAAGDYISALGVCFGVTRGIPSIAYRMI
jgi:hypothetical protein